MTRLIEIFRTADRAPQGALEDALGLAALIVLGAALFALTALA